MFWLSHFIISVEPSRLVHFSSERSAKLGSLFGVWEMHTPHGKGKKETQSSYYQFLFPFACLNLKAIVLCELTTLPQTLLLIKHLQILKAFARVNLEMVLQPQKPFMG